MGRFVIVGVVRALLRMLRPGLCLSAVLAAFLLPTTALAAGGDALIDGYRKHDFTPGDFAGWGQESLPQVILGPPEGAGALAGSTHVLSLGHGGAITVVFRDNLVVDEPGDDLVIFENAFHSGNEEGPIFEELAFVELSADGRHFFRLPYDAGTGSGLAGRTPVFANSGNGIDPLGEEAGGDRFDIADVGLTFVRYVRIVDGGDELADLGNLTFPGTKGGFDLDAAAALHSGAPGRVTGTVSASGAPVGGARVKLVAAGLGKWRRRTRPDGSFSFRRVLPAGDYLLRAGKKGVGRGHESIFVGLEQLRVDVDIPLD